MENQIHISLKKLRQNLSLTQVEMAEKLGVSQAFYSEMEAGLKSKTAKATAKLVAKVSEVFSLPTDWYNDKSISTNWLYCPHCGKPLK